MFLCLLLCNIQIRSISISSSNSNFDFFVFFNLNNFTFIYSCWKRVHECQIRRITCKNGFFPSFVWVQAIKLRWSGPEASTFTHRSSFPDLLLFSVDTVNVSLYVMSQTHTVFLLTYSTTIFLIRFVFFFLAILSL